MKYMLLIYGDEHAWTSLDEAAQQAVFAEYFQLEEELRAAGQYLLGEPLQPTSTATTVRRREGRTLVTDGPFAETREQLGGFFLLEVPDLDTALAIAARIPTALHGSIEVRPIQPIPEPGA
jgi:hypothetical protein